MKNFIYCNSVAAHPCYRKGNWFGGPKKLLGLFNQHNVYI